MAGATLAEAEGSNGVRGLLVMLTLFVAACATAPFARAESDFFFGFSDDGSRCDGSPARAT